MAQYWLDLTQSEASILAEFTTAGTQAGTVLDVQQDPENTGITVLEFIPAIGTTNGMSSASWDTVPAISGVTEILLYRRMPSSSATNFVPIGAALRLDGAANTGYVAGASNVNQEQVITKYSSGTRTELARGDVSNVTLPQRISYVWTLFYIDGSSLKSKTWEGDYADKPSAWDFEVTGSGLAGTLVGLLGRATTTQSNEGIFVQLMSVGTDGDPAPDTAPSVSGPTIDVQPQPQTVTEPDAATFSVTATTSGGVLSYQWKDDGANVGTNAATYNTGPTSVSMDGSQITVDVTDDNGTTVSNAALLTVNAAAGIKEMYIAKGGSFVSGVPHVAKGGSFVEPDSAWVVKNSGWVKVYEK